MKSHFVKKWMALSALIPVVANAEHNQSYQPPVFIDQDRLQKIQAILPKIDVLYRDYAEKNHIPGYAYGIVLDGKLIYTGSYGYANLTQKTPVTSQTIFRIASMTKSFTAMAILKLRDEGKLHLDDPVSLYIPAMKNQVLTQDAAPMTIRDLLTHSSGLPQDDPWGDRQLAATDKQFLDIISHGVSFSNARGTHYEYSNLAFTMLGYIIHQVSGMPFQEYIQENILKPIAMMHTQWEYTKVPRGNLAQGYRWIDSHWRDEPMLHDGAFGAMGGLMSSVEDFSHYVAFHLSAWPPRNDAEQGPIKRSSLREMHQPWRFNELTPQYSYLNGTQSMMTSAYGYGLVWNHDDKGQTIVSHSGGLPGFGSNWAMMPEYGLGVVVFANATYAPMEAINFTVLNTLVKSAKLMPRALPASQALVKKQQALMQLLPSWKGAEKSDIFANNFFLDHSQEQLKQETEMQFAKAGKILHVGAIVPENQLRGYFILQGENKNLQVNFTLSPQSPPLIQSFTIKEST